MPFKSGFPYKIDDATVLEPVKEKFGPSKHRQYLIRCACKDVFRANSAYLSRRRTGQSKTPIMCPKCREKYHEARTRDRVKQIAAKKKRKAQQLDIGDVYLRMPWSLG